MDIDSGSQVPSGDKLVAKLRTTEELKTGRKLRFSIKRENNKDVMMDIVKYRIATSFMSESSLYLDALATLDKSLTRKVTHYFNKELEHSKIAARKNKQDPLHEYPLHPYNDPSTSAPPEDVPLSENNEDDGVYKAVAKPVDVVDPTDTDKPVKPTYALADVKPVVTIPNDLFFPEYNKFFEAANTKSTIVTRDTAKAPLRWWANEDNGILAAKVVTLFDVIYTRNYGGFFGETRASFLPEEYDSRDHNDKGKLKEDQKADRVAIRPHSGEVAFAGLDKNLANDDRLDNFRMQYSGVTSTGKQKGVTLRSIQAKLLDISSYPNGTTHNWYTFRVNEFLAAEFFLIHKPETGRHTKNDPDGPKPNRKPITQIRLINLYEQSNVETPLNYSRGFPFDAFLSPTKTSRFSRIAVDGMGVVWSDSKKAWQRSLTAAVEQVLLAMQGDVNESKKLAITDDPNTPYMKDKSNEVKGALRDKELTEFGPKAFMS